jgi:sulfite exporter TauE/SafE/copper chaperone CopZ
MSRPRELVLPVAGMTCDACERRVSTAVRGVPGVRSARASAPRGRVVVELDEDVDPDLLRGAVERAGYAVARPPWFSADRTVWRRAVVAAVAVGAAGLLLWVTGGLEVAGVQDVAAGGLGVVLLLGLVAGFSTCIALVGGLLLAVTAAARDAGRPVAPMIGWFQVGRVVGFAVLGTLLGALGARLAVPPGVQAVLLLAVAVALAVLGIRLLGVSPRVAAWSPRLPGGLARTLRVEESAATGSPVRAAVLGAATFVLPCGFTQVVQLYALTTADPVLAGTALAVFALGTVPGLSLLGGAPLLAPSRREAVLAGAGAVLVVFAGLNTISAAGLLGVTPLPPAAVAASGVSPNVMLGPDVQVVRMTQTDRGYVPASTVVRAGLPIRWEITSESGISCAAFLRSEDGSLSRDLTTGLNVIALPAMQPGRFDFRCSMGMYSGTLVAVEGPTAARLDVGTTATATATG